jgi:hypothetical protein
MTHFVAGLCWLQSIHHAKVIRCGVMFPPAQVYTPCGQ